MSDNRAELAASLVDELNKRQKDGRYHPYTCGSGRRADADHKDGEGVLVATPTGWECPYCDYRQPYRMEGTL